MIRCPICDTDISDDSLKKTIVSPYNNQEYKLYHCPVCHIEFWYPLKIISEFYENDVFCLYQNEHSGKIKDIDAHHKLFFKYFKKFSEKLLDIGCSDGMFLHRAKELGFEVYGIDLDRHSVNIARNKRCLKNVYSMTLEEFVSFAKEKHLKFDVITFFEVLEHQDNPKRFIEDVKFLLKEGGYIAGSVPNRERLFANLERKESFNDFPPHHFLWFSEEVLKFFFKRQGFHNIEIYPVNVTIRRLSAQIEYSITQNFPILRRLRYMTKAKRVEDGNFPRNKGVYNVLGRFRDFVFSPLALVLYTAFKRRNGYQLYFYSKKVGR